VLCAIVNCEIILWQFHPSVCHTLELWQYAVIYQSAINRGETSGLQGLHPVIRLHLPLGLINQE